MSAKVADFTVAEFTNNAMRSYGSFVIEERAVADFRDGLKPVQRRILFSAQNDVKLKSSGRTVKSARVVGNTLGNYHPHGDSAVYGAMVNLVHPRYPLLRGQGNFGTLIDPPAASRYTEVGLTKISDKLFECLPVGEFVENYSGERKEPLVLPSRAPFLLMNGSEGIAVGLSANIPPHNLGDLLKALKYVLKRGDKSCCKAIAKLLQSPDFSFGGVLISEHEEVEELYSTGRASLKFRCEYHFEGRSLVVTSFAPRFNISGFITKCQDLVEKGMLEAVYDESSEDNGWRIVVEYKNAVPIRDHVIPMLHTSVPFIFYVTERLSEGKVKTTLKDMKSLLCEWIDYRREIETLMLKKERKELQETLDKCDAKLKAVRNWVKVSKAISNKTLTENQLLQELRNQLQLNETQAKYILKTELGVLRKSNEADHRKAYEKIQKRIIKVEKELKNIDDVIERELDALSPFVDERRTKIREAGPNLRGGTGSKMWSHIVAERGFIDYSAEIIKRKARPYSFLVDATNGFSVVTKGGTVRHYTALDDAQGDSTLRDIVGAASISKKALVLFLANADARGVTLRNPHRTLTEYAAFRTKHPIVFSCGLGRGDRIWVRDSNRTAMRIISPGDIRPSQRGGVGKKTFKGRKKDLEYLHVPRGFWVLDEYGHEVDEDSYLSKTRVLVIGPKDNYSVYDDGKKKILDLDEIAEELKNGASFAWIAPI